ncbi:AMP-binding protein [Dermatophilus congolensis]|uniref:AMP-binding protein n=1 Tax=Dermatophilus congolensis TaxID=1863 RepID=UPI000E0FD881|nr:AMP-binding protein [Dermatophilus congolensis]
MPEPTTTTPITPLTIPTHGDLTPAYTTLRHALDGNTPLLIPTASDHTPPTTATTATNLPPQATLAISTSGSTGTPKLATCTATALHASITATEHALGGPGQWILTLPPHHIAGLQVILRSLAAGHDPIPIHRTTSFTATHLATALHQAQTTTPNTPHYTSLVPTQLARLLNTTEGITTLRQLDAILVGGAATPTELINRAKDHNINLITTYGMSETCGGCVYNGHPIGDTTITFTNNTTTPTRIQLTGTHIAHGYLNPTDNPTTLTLNTNTPFTHHPNGTRTYLTDDIGHINPDGTLTLEGRTDDIINTGGLKVLPTHVEKALAPHLPPGTTIHVTGIPHPEWGTTVAAAFAPTNPTHIKHLQQLIPTALTAARETLPPHAIPRHTIVLPHLPQRGPGKPDRAAIRNTLIRTQPRPENPMPE